MISSVRFAESITYFNSSSVLLFVAAAFFGHIKLYDVLNASKAYNFDVEVVRLQLRNISQLTSLYCLKAFSAALHVSVGERNLDISECVCTSKALRITIILTLSATMLCAILAAAHKPFLRRLKPARTSLPGQKTPWVTWSQRCGLLTLAYASERLL